MEKFKDPRREQDLTNKTVVITGASSGVGRAAAIEFARHGAKVILAARREEALDEVAQECNHLGALAVGVPTDVTDAEAMQRLAEAANEFGGGIDIWINNAGVLAAGEFTEIPIDVHEQIIRINLMGYLHGAYAVLPYFKKQKRGILINNISVGGWFPVPYGVGYSASKYGLRGYSEALRGELTRYPKIHVCDLFPAFLDTPGIQHAANYTGKVLKPAPPVYDPQEVARAMVSVALHPKKQVTIGGMATFLRLANALLPGLTRTITTKVIETYLKSAEPVPHTTGNLFQPTEYGTGMHGAWSLRAEPQKKSIAGALIIAGLTTALVLFGQTRKPKTTS